MSVINKNEFLSDKRKDIEKFRQELKTRESFSNAELYEFHSWLASIGKDLRKIKIIFNNDSRYEKLVSDYDFLKVKLHEITENQKRHVKEDM